jgi:putative membrane protein
MEKANIFFTDEEKNRISAATRRVESETSGEIAVMVVDSSEQYRDAEIIGGVVLGSIAAFVLTELLFSASLWFYIPLSALFFVPFKYLTAAVPDLKTAFIGRERKNSAVGRRAVSAFYEKGLYKTCDSTGVLFFIALMEHKVWVLADKGIYAKIDQETLNRFAATVTQGIKEGRASDALCNAILGIGEILTVHFPVKHGDTNELSDDVMTE